MNKKVIIIGSGPAGLTAAIYTSRGNLDTTVFEGLQPGGQLTTTTEIDNFPGFPEGLPGPDLMDRMKAQAKRFGSKIEAKQITKVDFLSTPKKIWINDELHEADAVIIATGARSKMLNLPREKEFFARGLHTCATCDGFFYKNKTIAVIGGGDSAMEEANFLSKFADKLYIIHRRDEFRASKIMQQRTFDNPKIEILWNTEVESYLGEDKFTGLKIKNSQTGANRELLLDGVFMAIGHLPNTEIFAGQVDLNDKQNVIVRANVYTSVEGVFAAGDCADYTYRQAITAAGLGCMAAMAAERWLELAS